jgi:hypothetical protein
VALIYDGRFEALWRPLLKPGRMQRLYARHDYWIRETAVAAGLFSGGHNSGGTSQFVERLADQLVVVGDKQRRSFRQSSLNQSCGDNRFPRADGGDAQQSVVLAPAL